MIKLKITDKERFIKIIIAGISLIVTIILSVCISHCEKAQDEKFFAENEAKVKEQITLEYTHNIMNQTEVKQMQYYAVPLSLELQDYISSICNKYGVDMRTVLAVMETESNFKHNTNSPNTSESGSSIGIMQLNENYIEWYKELTGEKSFNIHNIKDNILGGVCILKYYQDYWKDKVSPENLDVYVLNTYNCGVAGYKSYIRRYNVISRGYDKKVRESRNNIKVK